MMKARIFKAFALLLWLGLWQTGCYPDKFDPEGDEVGPIATLDFSNPSVEFKAEAESRTVTLTTNYKTYRVDVPEEASSWCRVTSEGMTLTIAVDENPFNRERSATISVTVGKGSKELTKTVSVFQLGTLPQIKISDSRLNFVRENAGAKEVTVTTNQDEWTYSAVGGNDAWFEVTRDGDKLRVKPRGANTGKDTRRGYINLTSASAMTDVTASGMVMVEQLGTAPAVLLSEEMLSFSADGGEYRVQVVTNQPDWQLHLPPVDWYEASAEGDEMVISVKKNTGGNARKSELTVASGTGNAFANLSLAQLGTAVSLEVSTDVLKVAAAESYSTLRVTTNADEWEASVTGGADWCELMEDANNAIVYTKAYSNTTTPRECTITFTAGSLQKTVRVIQLPNMTLTLNHDTLRMDPAGETRNVLVLTNQSSWEFSMTPEMAEWCTVAASGNTLTVTTGANNGSARDGEIAVTVGEPGTEKSVILRVSQDGFSDRDILVALYNATDGANWMENTYWCSDMPLSEWYGVTCNEEGRVVELELSGNNLKGSIPGELGNLSSLTYLVLSFNQLSGSIPSAMGRLVGLTELSLHNNQLTGAIPAELGNLSSVTELGLGKNQLGGSIPAELGQLTGLTYLDLSENQLTGTIPAELGNLVNLTALDLNDNRLTGSIPAALGNLIGLQSLWLYNNRLTGEIPEELGNLTGLMSLGLYNNQLTGAVPASLGNLTGLMSLTLHNNRLTGIFPEEIKALQYWSGFNADVNIYPQQEGYGFTRPGPASYNVTLKLRGDNGEATGRAESNPLYGVQVMSREKGSTGAYGYYAYGIFDDTTAINLNLSDEMEYRFRATMVDDAAAIHASGGEYGKPFNTAVAPAQRGVTPLPDWEGDLPGGNGTGWNSFLVTSEKYLAGLERGETTLAADGKTYARPNAVRYFGERFPYTPSADEEVEVRMTRVAFAVTCEVDSLKTGYVRVEMEGAPVFRVDSDSEEHSASEVFTLANSGGNWTGSDYAEEVTVRFFWVKPNGLERDLGSQQVAFKRNTVTRMKITIKDDGMSMDMENKPLEDGQIYEIEGIIW